jgi:hypothetical protein
MLKQILKWTGIFFVILAIGFHAVVKFWLGPAYVAVQVEKALSEFWSGPVRVEDIEFNYDGVMFIREVGFQEKNGAEIIKAGDVKLVLGNWPSLTAPAKRIEVERLDVQIRLDGGKPVMPLRVEQNSQSGEPRPDYMSVKHITVSVEEGESELVFDRLYAEISKVEGIYQINAGRNEDGNSYKARLDGVLDLDRGDVEMNLSFTEKAVREQMRVLLSVAGVPAAWGCEGKVSANLRVMGNLNDVESLWPKGTAEFENWTIIANQHIFAENVNGVLVIRNRRLDLERFNGSLCKGNFNSSFYLDVRQHGPVTYGGDVLVTGTDMTELTDILGTTKKFTKGTGLLNLKFAGDANGVDSVRGNGAIFLNDADLWRFPVIGELFKSIGIWEYQVGGISDAEAVFGLSGLEMTVERGHLSNQFSAIEAERGGKINLQNGQIDMYVVAIPLKKVENIINRIPLVNWLAHFKDKLIRLRLKGHWSEPAGKLIGKQPIKDLTEATIGFFVDIFKSGGQLTEKTIKGFGFDRTYEEPKDK